MDSCEHLNDVVRAEMPALKIAYLHRQLSLSREMHTKIPYDVAKKQFEEKFIGAFAEGYKLCYCYNVCPDRKTCDIKEKEETYLKKLEGRINDN